MRYQRERDILRKGYQVLAREAHPDKGGTAEQMILLNAARDRMLGWIESAEQNVSWPPADNPGPRTPNPEARVSIPYPQPPMSPVEFLNYARREMQKDPVGASLVEIIDTLAKSFTKRKWTRRKRM